MLSNAHKMLRHIGSSALVPPNGTGPLGVPGGGNRWITRDDVVVWNAETSIQQTQRHAFGTTLKTRSFTHVPNTLREYQLEAVRMCNPEDGVFLSGIINMECGTGKTWVASELIRRSMGPCIVLAQHTVSVAQFAAHLESTLHIRTMTLQEDDVADPCTYDVIVTTYSRAVRIINSVDEHRTCIEKGCFYPPHSKHDRLFIQQMCDPFSLLILDEVHMAVADKFLSVCRLRAHTVIGLSGSLVREDDRIDSLDTVVGPTRYCYGNSNRRHEIRVHRIPVHDECVRDSTARTVVHQTIRALNPNKVDALLRIVDEHRGQRIIVFSDTVQPTEVLSNTVFKGGSIVLNGSVSSRGTRDEIINVFSQSPPGSLILLCTKVCDVSIDFPVGCIIVQFHITSGSRQQEVQRCGRGTRGSDGAVVYHLVNMDTEEERFSERRIQHLREEMWGTVDVTTMDIDSSNVHPSSMEPIQSLMRIKIENATSKSNAKRPRLPSNGRAGRNHS